jgi:5'-nucleotidase/UDP-sugar diphosphatase
MKKIYIVVLFLWFSKIIGQEKVVIFSINDPHSRINNFPRLKKLIDNERALNNKVFFVCAGDIFSGSPIVDFHPNKGYPMIDLLDDSGLDICVIGNHEFDYGQDILNDRIEQAKFPFICDNVSGANGALANVNGFELITKDDFKIAFVGVVETGSPGLYPRTHPKRVQGLTFTEGLESFVKYEHLKEEQNADLFVALTHYGSSKDRNILENFPFVDLVIGGHTNSEYGYKYQNGYMIMSGGNLEKVSKTTITVTNKTISDFEFELIDLSDPLMPFDSNTQKKVDDYNNVPEFFEVIGVSEVNHNKSETGCLYTEALLNITESDFVIQNMGGIRNVLDQGEVTPFDIYSIDPFSNGLDLFQMTVIEIREFLNNYPSSFSFSTSLEIYKDENQVYQFIKNGTLLSDTDRINFSLNDYISNVYDSYFPTPFTTFELTTAEYIIEYIRDKHQGNINYDECYQRESTLASTLTVENSNKIEKFSLENPVGDFLNISDQFTGNLSIYDSNGKLLLQNKNLSNINVSKLKTGLYFVIIQEGNNTYSITRYLY